MECLRICSCSVWLNVSFTCCGTDNDGSECFLIARLHREHHQKRVLVFFRTGFLVRSTHDLRIGSAARTLTHNTMGQVDGKYAL